jgi:hypothetical protein
MTLEETQAYVKQIKKFAEKVTSSKAKSMKFLAKTGVYSKKGILKAHYR